MGSNPTPSADAPVRTYDDTLEAFQVIRCMDTAERTTVEEDDARSAEYRRVSPRLAPATIGSYFCTFFPPTTEPRIEVKDRTAVPIVVEIGRAHV